MNVADDRGLRPDHAERQAFRAWMTPLMRADVPRRRVPDGTAMDHALARLEGLEFERHAHWLRGAIVASVASSSRGVQGIGPSSRWRRRALTVFAFRDVEEDLLPWRRVRSRALRALRQDAGLRLPLNLHAALRFAPTEMSDGALRELALLARTLDDSLDSLMLQAACDWLAGAFDLAWSRLETADGIGAPAHRPEVTRRWQACLRAFLREEQGDLEGALVELVPATHPERPRLDHALLRISLATFTDDPVRIARERSLLGVRGGRGSGGVLFGESATSRGELVAALLPRIARWRRLRPGRPSVAVRQELRALRRASATASASAPFAIAAHLLGELA